MNEQDLRDCFAMFALNGILSCNYDVGEEPAILAYKYADEMLKARTKIEKTVDDEELGIAAVRVKRNVKRTSA
jgi:hypothetical protein